LNPLWINDLGFQLSFLATFGLIVTAPPIQKQLDFLPSILSEPSAITLAATLWTLPLLLHTFSSIALYSLITNVITNPLVVIVSLGGIFSAFLALVYPPLGSLSASILYYPIELLLQILKFFTSLPMSVLATGKLSLGVMVILYGLLGLLTVNPRFQKKWYLVGLFMIGLILIPIVYQSLTLTRVTVFATKNEPAIVIQDRGKTILIGGNDPDTARYTVIPFLREQGINQIQEAIALDPNANRTAIQEEIPIDREITVTKGNINSIAFQSDRSSLQFQLQGKTWLLITDNKNFSSLSVKPFALLWKGKSIDKKWLETLKPRVAIASSFSRATRQDLKNLNIDYFQTGRDGAIQWTPRQGFQRFIEEDRSLE
jgi:competence protein ComEC